MKVVHTLKTFWRKTLKNPLFWEYFPEYSDVKLKLENKELPMTCCSMAPKTVLALSQLVLDNPEKWKKYLDAEKINVYTGTKVISV